MMNTKSLSQRRYWTQVAQDIGAVLRKQIVESRVKRVTESQRKYSAHKIIKGLINDEKISKQPISNKKVYFMAPLKRLKTQKIQNVGQSNFQTLKSIKQIYDKTSSAYSFAHEMSPSRELQHSRQRDADMMRKYLHRLKIQNNVKKIFNEKEKQYKVWKYRTMQKKKITLEMDNTTF